MNLDWEGHGNGRNKTMGGREAGGREERMKGGGKEEEREVEEVE